MEGVASLRMGHRGFRANFSNGISNRSQWKATPFERSRTGGFFQVAYLENGRRPRWTLSNAAG